MTAPAVVEPPVVETDQAIVEAQAQVDAAEAARVAAEAVIVPSVTTEAAPAAPVVPEKYELKVPDGTDPGLVERTTAIARELGLGNEAGQKLLDREIALEADAQTARTAAIDAWRPGGTEWTKRDEGWRAQVAAHPELGGKNLDATLEAAARGMTQLFPPEFKKVLNETGFGSHPDVVAALAKVGRAGAEGALVNGVTVPAASAPRKYGLYNDDGSPVTPAV